MWQHAFHTHTHNTTQPHPSLPAQVRHMDDPSVAGAMRSRCSFLCRPGLHVVHVASEMAPIAKVAGFLNFISREGLGLGESAAHGGARRRHAQALGPSCKNCIVWGPKAWAGACTWRTPRATRRVKAAQATRLLSQPPDPCRPRNCPTTGGRAGRRRHVARKGARRLRDAVRGTLSCPLASLVDSTRDAAACFACLMQSAAL